MIVVVIKIYNYSPSRSDVAVSVFM